MTPIAGVACAIDGGFPPIAEARKIEAIPIPMPIKATMHTIITVGKIRVPLSRIVVSPFAGATPVISARIQVI